MFLSRITWWWQNSQIWHGWRRPLVYDDLVDLNSYDKSEVVAPVFQKHWNTELRKAGWAESLNYSNIYCTHLTHVHVQCI